MILYLVLTLPWMFIVTLKSTSADTLRKRYVTVARVRLDA